MATVKRFYLAEWLEDYDPPLTAADLSRATGIEKSQISRWIRKGQKPGDESLEILRRFFNLSDAKWLLRHPNEYWVAQFLNDRSDAELKRIRASLEVTFPKT